MKRKRAAARTRKSKAEAAQPRLNGQQGTKGRKRGLKNSGNDSEDDSIEAYIPKYVHRRRNDFELNRTKLETAGLKLPPSYDDIHFSDDERLEIVRERPDFQNRKIRPPAQYKDIILPYSLGLIPAPIAQWLRDYQVKGVEFLHELFVYQKGGILGDDMGLGKTIQVIAFLTVAFGKTGDERDVKRMRKMRRSPRVPWYPRALVICPGGLMENWKAELDQWGYWHVDIFHGDSKEAAIETARTGRTEIMITTYATYRLNKDRINMIEWDCVIADECQIIKERSSEITQAMNEINALCRIGLTGTAIQNKYEELWTLLNWTNPGRFGPCSTWTASISEPLKIGQSHDATVYELRRARETARKLVQNLLPEFFLRRMKSLIAHQLPKKSDKVVFCPLTTTQRDAYELFLDSEPVDAIRRSSELCDCDSKKKRGWCCYATLEDGRKWQDFVFPAISNLQKLSNHLAILIPQGADPKEKQAKDLEALQIALPNKWRELFRNRDSILNFSNPEFCGKWKILKKLLRFWHGNGDKVLVFSHSVRFLKMLQILFNHTSYNVSYLDGGMSYIDRAQTVANFNADDTQFVFLISTRAGGVGLNITSANKVVIMDPNWNPSYDLQAQDRAYRIGQVRDVEVFRLVSAGTIEEIVYARQIYKQQQANIGYNASTERRYFTGVQEKSDKKGEIFGMKNLFSFQADNVVLRNIVNKTNVAESKAGVDVVGLDLEEALKEDDDFMKGENQESAMSQLATFITEEAEGKKTMQTTKIMKKADPIAAILARAGVEYTHENSEVVGSSKVEAQLSRYAEQADKGHDGAEQHVFAQSQHGPLSPTLSSSPQRERSKGLNPQQPINYRYHPPRDVMKRQFCTMARHFGFADAVEFALVVEGWTQEQRRSCLERFYRARKEVIMASEGHIRDSD